MKSIRADSHGIRNALILIACLGLGTRFLAFPFATTNSSDPISRIWIAWHWLSNPEIITHGVWGPLHFYLIAFSMAIVRDPIVPPVLLNIIFSAATAILLYFFIKSEFGSHSVSLLVAVTYIFYPIAVRESLMATEVPPFLFFLILSLLFLSITRQDQGSWKHALYAGIALTLASMLRYEGWMLIPLLVILLWRKPKFMMVFVASSMIHPVFWMIGNGIHYGDPLYSINWASNWNINIEGANENLSLGEIVSRVRFYPTETLHGMTPVVAAFCLSGAALSLMRRQRYAVWLIPFLSLVCLFIISAVKGSLALKTKYTVTLGTLLFPFSAEFYRYLRIPQQTARKELLIGLLIVGSMIFFSYPSDAIPGFGERKEIKALSAVINEHLKTTNEAFICDFFGWGRTHYVALMTRLHPNEIFVAPGSLHQELSIEILSNFVNNHQMGIILLNKGSRFAQSIQFHDSGKARVGNNVLSLEIIRFVTLSESEIGIYRYKVNTNR